MYEKTDEAERAVRKVLENLDIRGPQAIAVLEAVKFRELTEWYLPGILSKDESDTPDELFSPPSDEQIDEMMGGDSNGG